MSENSDDFTRDDASFVARLKNSEDREAWQHLFHTHWKAIYDVALKAGLNEMEAQDLVQETFIAAAKRLPEDQYCPARGSLRSWLLQLARWRVTEQLQKRRDTGHGTGSRGDVV